MARPKRPPHPLLRIAKAYIETTTPELREAPLHLHHLDGPPGSPRFAISAEVCPESHNCPFGITSEVADAGKCPVINCSVRHSVRLLYNRDGTMVKEMQSGTHWE